MGEGGLATALIVAHLRHVVPQTDTARDFTNELLPFLWRFRASPQGLKGHTNEMKLLVSGEEFESPLQESKSCLLPVTTSGSISQRGFLFPSVSIILLLITFVNTFPIYFYLLTI